MRKSLRASLLEEFLEREGVSPILGQDPELRDIVGLCRLLEGAGRLEIRPEPQRQQEIKLRLLQRREELSRDPERRRVPDLERVLRPVLREYRRYAYAGAVAFLLLAVVAFSAFWYMSRPAEKGVLPGVGPRLALHLDAPGPVEVRYAGGEWEAMEGSIELPEGSSLRTLGQRVEVCAGDAAFFRMDLGSEVEVAALEEGALELLLCSGRAYHRVLRPFDYNVRIEEVRCSAHGTAFSTERRGGTGLLVLAVQDETQLRHGPANVVLTPGKRYLVGDVLDPGATGTAEPVLREEIDEGWLRYNLEEDLRRGLDPGILPELLDVPLPPEPTTVVLGARDTERGVLLEWQVSGPEPASFEVLRSSTVRQPVAPDHLYRVVSDPAARRFLDTNLARGTTYHYRIAALVGGDRIYSNAVAVATHPEPQPGPPPLPPPEPPREPRIILSGRQVQGSSSYLAVQLDWSLEGDLQVDAWMVCRSISDPYPAYPPEGYDSHAFFCTYKGRKGSFLDEDTLYTGYTYHYRIAALYHNEVVLYSNAISVELMTIIP